MRQIQGLAFIGTTQVIDDQGNQGKNHRTEPGQGVQAVQNMHDQAVIAGFAGAVFQIEITHGRLLQIIFLLLRAAAP